MQKIPPSVLAEIVSKVDEVIVILLKFSFPIYIAPPLDPLEIDLKFEPLIETVNVIELNEGFPNAANPPF